MGPHCSFRNSHRILEVLENFFGLRAGEKNEKVDLDICRCTDNCDFGPNVVENDNILYTDAKTKNIVERIEKNEGKPIVPFKIEDLHLDDDLL